MKKRRYSKELIKKAIRMRKQGYQFAAIASYLDMDKWAVIYHASPARRLQSIRSTRRWQKENRERWLETMRNYNHKIQKIKRNEKSTTD